MKTKLETFAEAVAHNTLGKPDDNNAQFDIVAILQFIELVGTIVNELINACPANNKAVRESFKKPNWLQRVRFRAAVKQNCDCCARLQFRAHAGKLADNMINEASKMTDEDLDKVISEVRDLDNWII
jgi:hypothetical protein